MATVHSYNAFVNGEQMLSPHFKVSEFQCSDGSGAVLIADELIDILEKIRTHFGKPVHINSGYRTNAHNAKIGGATKSQHCQGTAADITVSGIDTYEVAKYAETLMPSSGGIGWYNYSGGFTHVDVRSNRSRWQQNAKSGPELSVAKFA